MEGGIVLEAAGEISEEAGARWSVLASWRLPDAGTKAASFGRPDLVKAASLERPPDHVEAGALEEVADVVGLEVASFGRPDPVEASALEEAAGCWEGGGRRRHGTRGGVVELAPSTDLCQGRP
jgi:hypothetical protein